MKWFFSMSRFAQAVLVMSLAINVFFVSAVIARALGDKTQADTAAEPSMRRMIERLPEADAKLVREALALKRTQLAEARASYRRSLAQIDTLLTQEPVDKAALESAVRRAGAARVTVTQLRTDIYSNVLPRLSKEGRKLATKSD
jgi:uncharacterized membrane protein